jgi:hypothetical protein
MLLATDGTEKQEPQAVLLRSAKLFIFVWACYSVFIFTIRPKGHMTEYIDFRAYYSAGVLAMVDPSHLYDLARQHEIQNKLVGQNPSEIPFIAPPYIALLYVPFAGLNYETAYRLFMICNLVLILISFFFARRAILEGLDLWYLGPELVFFLYLPLTIALVQGQPSIVVLLLCCLTWHEIEASRDGTAGFLLALTLFKLQFAIPLGLLLIVRRGWRMACGFAGGVAAIMTLSIWIVGRIGVASYLALLAKSTLIRDDSLQLQAATHITPSAFPNLRGLLYGLGGNILPHSLELGVTLILSLAMLLWSAYVLRKRLDEATAVGFAVIVALLLSFYLYFHDLTVMLLAIALLGQRHLMRHFSLLVGTCWILPPIIVYLSSTRRLFLASVPMLGLLWVVARQIRITSHEDFRHLSHLPFPRPHIYHTITSRLSLPGGPSCRLNQPSDPDRANHEM